MTYVPSQPVQGQLFHRLTSMIASNYSGLGPNNVASNPYQGMTGLAFQKPLSGGTAMVPLSAFPHVHR